MRRRDDSGKIHRRIVISGFVRAGFVCRADTVAHGGVAVGFCAGKMMLLMLLLLLLLLLLMRGWFAKGGRGGGWVAAREKRREATAATTPVVRWWRHCVCFCFKLFFVPLQLFPFLLLHLFFSSFSVSVKVFSSGFSVILTLFHPVSPKVFSLAFALLCLIFSPFRCLPFF